MRRDVPTEDASDPANLTYAAVPGTAPDIYVVTVTDSTTGENGKWSVNVETGDLTPADPIAAEASSFCPNLG